MIIHFISVRRNVKDEYDYEKFHLTMHCFLSEVTDGHLKLNTHNDAKWIELDELNNPRWVPADILVVKAIKNM